MQAYFQLQNFEEDIPGLECRAENVKKHVEDQQENVTLEEASKTKGTEENSVAGKKKNCAGEEEEND